MSWKKESYMRLRPPPRGIAQDMFNSHITGIVTKYECCQQESSVGVSYMGGLCPAHTQIPSALRKAGIQHQPYDLC